MHEYRVHPPHAPPPSIPPPNPPFPFPPMPPSRFISSFLKWNRRVRGGEFEPDARPGCLRGYALQAGTARVSRRRRDEVQHYPASRHAVVFCNNRVFRLNLLGGEDGESQVRFGKVEGGGR